MIRRSGQTTRRVDEIIQLLFQSKKVHVIDHHGSREANKHLMNWVIRRLKNEHRRVSFHVDERSNTIELSNPKQYEPIDDEPIKETVESNKKVY